MTLTFDDANLPRGKTTPDTDVVKGRFVDLETNRSVTTSPTWIGVRNWSASIDAVTTWRTGRNVAATGSGRGMRGRTRMLSTVTAGIRVTPLFGTVGRARLRLGATDSSFPMPSFTRQQV